MPTPQKEQILQDTSERIREVRRDIARIKTIAAQKRAAETKA